MKRISWLSLILLFSFGAMIVHQGVLTSIESASSGWSIGSYEAKHGTTINFYDMRLKLKVPMEKPIEEAKNRGEKTAVVPQTAMVMSLDKNGNNTFIIYDNITTAVSCIVLPVVIWAFVLFFRVFISFWKTKVFEEKNIKRFRKIGVLFVITGMLHTIIQTYGVVCASGLVELRNYEFSYADCVDWDNLTTGLLILLFSEILKFSLNMKAEQDLTI